jgi:hypothetical protein
VDAGTPAGGSDAGGTTAGGSDAGGSTAGGTTGDGNASDGGTDAGSTDSGETDGTGGDGMNPTGTAANPDMVSVFQGETVIINVLDNDNDGPGLGLTVVSFTDPPNGTAKMEEGSNIAYTPDFGFFGIDTFMYVIEDSQGNQATGTVTIEVIRFSDINDNAINDYDECNCVSLQVESGIHGSGLGGKFEWLTLLALLGALGIRCHWASRFKGSRA